MGEHDTACSGTSARSEARFKSWGNVSSGEPRARGERSEWRVKGFAYSLLFAGRAIVIGHNRLALEDFTPAWSQLFSRVHRFTFDKGSCEASTLIQRRMARRNREDYPMNRKLQDHEITALQAFAKEHGRNWKSALILNWGYARVWTCDSMPNAGNFLHALRNEFGATWLYNFKLPKAEG